MARRNVSTSWMDSTAWDQFAFRPTDIVISAFPRSGMTWMQQIIRQLLLPEMADADIWPLSPWMEQRLPNERKLRHAESQKHRRFFKSHAPFDALPYDQSVRYIYVARDGRDVARSTYDTFYSMTLKSRGEQPLDFRSYFLQWLQQPGGELHYFEHIKSWWRERDRANVKLIHHQQLKNNLVGEMTSLASFLAVELSAPVEKIAEQCQFSYMKANAAKLLRGQESHRPGVGKYMIFKGDNARWKDSLMDEDSEAYAQLSRKQLGEECARWLAGDKASAAAR